jgi:hypothetical protein
MDVWQSSTNGTPPSKLARIETESRIQHSATGKSSEDFAANKRAHKLPGILPSFIYKNA